MTSSPSPSSSPPTHLPQDDLLVPRLPGQQQQAADQQLLLQRETLSVRGSAPAALRRHAVAVHLRQHPGHLRQADPRACVKRGGRRGGGEVSGEARRRERDEQESDGDCDAHRWLPPSAREIVSSRRSPPPPPLAWGRKTRGQYTDLTQNWASGGCFYLLNY